jgi:hypothetical protein
MSGGSHSLCGCCREETVSCSCQESNTDFPFQLVVCSFHIELFWFPCWRLVWEVRLFITYALPSDNSPELLVTVRYLPYWRSWLVIQSVSQPVVKSLNCTELWERENRARSLVDHERFCGYVQIVGTLVSRKCEARRSSALSCQKYSLCRNPSVK